MIEDDPFGLWFQSLFNDPVVMITEIAGLCILVFIIMNNKLYSLSAISAYLKTNSPVIQETHKLIPPQEKNST